jgi:predicted negative regulator of RcsB-dependent stress response
MFKIKSRKKAEPDPAQLVGSFEQAAGLARENLTWLMAGVAVAVVVSLAVGGFYWKRQQDDRAAAEMLHEVLPAASTDLPFGSPPRRPEESKKAVEVCRKVLAEFPRSSVAPQAAYLLGNTLSDLKDWDSAIKAYQEFLARYGDNRSLAPLVYQRLAYAQLSQGKVEEGEKTLAAIVKIEGAPNKDQALFELAKINELLNRPEGALARYQEIMKDYPHSPFANEASVRIKTLDTRKATATPAPPAPPAATTPPPR